MFFIKIADGWVQPCLGTLVLEATALPIVPQPLCNLIIYSLYVRAVVMAQLVVQSLPMQENHLQILFTISCIKICIEGTKIKKRRRRAWPIFKAKLSYVLFLCLLKIKEPKILKLKFWTREHSIKLCPFHIWTCYRFYANEASKQVDLPTYLAS